MKVIVYTTPFTSAFQSKVVLPGSRLGKIYSAFIKIDGNLRYGSVFVLGT
ncbi:hypothetical protein QE422_002164 [Chryseobacterium sp. SORGH_AS 447]|nr:hypothetical protein [Chryseobacterium sp. SORGH_AS_0447]